MKQFYNDYRYLVTRVAKSLKKPWPEVVRTFGAIESEMWKDVDRGMSIAEASKKWFCHQVCDDKGSIPGWAIATQHNLINTIIMLAEAKALTGNCLHIFIESAELAEFLMGLVPRADKALLKIFSGCDERVGIIHTPGGKDPAVLFSVHHCGDVVTRCGDMIGMLCETEFGEKPVNPSTHLVFATGLYVAAFPHALKPGLPSQAKFPAHYKGRTCLHLTAVPQILDRTGPIPHIRSGHTRFLQSARFTNKRFQFVGVSQAIIKGKAKTLVKV